MKTIMRILHTIFSLLIFFNSQLSLADYPKDEKTSMFSIKMRTKSNSNARIDSNFKNRSDVLGSGGNISSSLNYTSINCIGQPSPIGMIENANFINRSGFLATVLNNYRIAGKTFYALNKKPVRRVSIYLCSKNSQCLNTNDAGYYELDGLEEGESYQVVPKKYNDFIEDLTISLTDAQRVHLYLAGSLQFNDYERLASDVDENGVVDDRDELLIIKRALLNTSVDTVKDHCGQWRFVPGKYCYIGLPADPDNQDFNCIILGDNDGSWQYSSFSKPAIEPVCCSALQDLVNHTDSLITVPLSLNTAYRFLFAEIRMEFDPSIVNLVDCYTTESTTDFKLVTEVDSSKGVIACALFAPDTLLLKGDVIRFQFKVTGKAGEVTQLTLAKLFINESIMLQSQAQLTITSPNAIPERYQLYQNFPNPCNSITVIRYDLANMKAQATVLQIYNLRGQLVKTLLDRNQQSGFHRAVWDGTNETGDPVASGVYIYRLSSGNFHSIRKLVILK